MTTDQKGREDGDKFTGGSESVPSFNQNYKEAANVLIYLKDKVQNL